MENSLLTAKSHWDWRSHCRRSLHCNAAELKVLAGRRHMTIPLKETGGRNSSAPPGPPQGSSSSFARHAPKLIKTRHLRAIRRPPWSRLMSSRMPRPRRSGVAGPTIDIARVGFGVCPSRRARPSPTSARLKSSNQVLLNAQSITFLPASGRRRLYSKGVRSSRHRRGDEGQD